MYNNDNCPPNCIHCLSENLSDLEVFEEEDNTEIDLEEYNKEPYYEEENQD